MDNYAINRVQRYFKLYDFIGLFDNSHTKSYLKFIECSNRDYTRIDLLRKIISPRDFKVAVICDWTFPQGHSKCG